MEGKNKKMESSKKKQLFSFNIADEDHQNVLNNEEQNPLDLLNKITESDEY